MKLSPKTKRNLKQILAMVLTFITILIGLIAINYFFKVLNEYESLRILILVIYAAYCGLVSNAVFKHYR